MDGTQAMAGRYSRQVVLPQIGTEGQELLSDSRVLVLGLGALGTALASTMVRAGVGFVRLVDRDFIELNNLQRQVLFDEEDIAAGLPKAVAAARKLARANSSVTVEPVVADVTARNIERLVQDCDLVLDGSDNFEVRLLLNDACLKMRKPWVYGAAIGTIGMTMPLLPGEGPCFRCLVPALSAPGTVPTCDMVGVLGTVPQLVAALQATEALKLLSGNRQALCRSLRFVDAWTGTIEKIDVGEGDVRCPACAGGRFDYLEGTVGSVTVKMCGRTAVQVDPGRPAAPEFAVLAARLAPLGEVTFNAHLLRFRAGEKEVALFADGRAIIKGARDEAEARSLYARYVGL
jgi:adenylyltransferase/sulfurtransferase